MNKAENARKMISYHVGYLRDQYHLSYRDLAESASRFGMKWNAATIRNFEREKVALTLENLIVLAAIERDLTNLPVSLIDLFNMAKGKDVQLEFENIVIPYDLLSEVLGNTPVNLTNPSDRPLTDIESVAYYAQAHFTKQELNSRANADTNTKTYPKRSDSIESRYPRKFAPGKTLQELIHAAELPTLSDKNIAKRSGLSPEEVLIFSLYLWGKRLGDEARLRAGNNASPQKVGSESRKLVKLLSDTHELHMQSQMANSDSEND